MQEGAIGVLGGMGPEATLNCFAKILANTPAENDQEHLNIVIVNNPKIPDRTQAVLENGPSPLPSLIQGCRKLEKAGADFVIMPCVTAHFYEAPLKQAINLPFLSILDAVAANIKQHHPEIKRIGLMGTSGTLQSGVFQKRLNKDGLETLTCPSDMQARVMQAIYDIKSASSKERRAQITAELASTADYLVKQGVQGVIAGCTEIPLALGQRNVAVPYFDSLLILARAAIRRAGRDPIPLW